MKAPARREEMIFIWRGHQVDLYIQAVCIIFLESVLVSIIKINYKILNINNGDFN